VSLQRSIEEFESHGAAAEATRDRYALGVLTAGAVGSEMVSAAARALESMGYVDPLGQMSSYFPELFCGA
jgi:hypothetical protein